MVQENASRDRLQKSIRAGPNSTHRYRWMVRRGCFETSFESLTTCLYAFLDSINSL